MLLTNTFKFSLCCVTVDSRSDNTAASCRTADLPSIAETTNTAGSLAEVSAGTVVTYTCNSGETVPASTELFTTCQRDGTFTPVSGSCASKHRYNKELKSFKQFGIKNRPLCC